MECGLYLRYSAVQQILQNIMQYNIKLRELIFIQQMRGIQINNYFNNQITFNGKKVANQGTLIAQPSRPKPLIINHVVQPNNVCQSKQGRSQAKPQPKSQFKHQKKQENKIGPKNRRKRVTTVLQMKSPLKKRSVSLQRLMRNESIPKKKEGSSEERQQNTLIDISHRKPKKGGLGNRSKSTIIKPSYQFNLNQSLADNSVRKNKNKKKQSKQIKKNIVSEQKKTNQDKKILMTRIPSSFLKRSKQIVPKTPKMQKFLSEKKALQSQRTMIGKSGISSAKQSKPVSARQKIKVPKQKLFREMESSQKGSDKKSATIININQECERDQQFVKVIANLQVAMNNVPSKAKLKKQLMIITQKLKQLEFYKEQFQNQFEGSVKNNDNLVNDYKIECNQINLAQQDQQQQYDHNKHLVVNKMHFYQSSSEEYCIQDMQISNPMISRRNNNIDFLQEYPKEQQSLEDDRKKQLQSLKMFKIQSNKLMKKFQPKKQLNLITDDKYPSALKSPKFSQQQLMNIVSMKQKCIVSKYDKMSELVQKMFQKQIVSPKSFDFKMIELRKKFQQDNQALEQYKKQAQSILKDIKKDKQQIQNIDQLIRKEKWKQSQKYIKRQNDNIWQKMTIQLPDAKQPQLISNNTQSYTEYVLDQTNKYQQIHPQQIEYKTSQDLNNKPQQQIIYYNDDQLQENKALQLIQVPPYQQLLPKEQPLSLPQKQMPNLSGVSQRKGFDTNIYFIRQYCIALCEHVRQSPQHTLTFKQNMRHRLQYDERTLLQLMRTNLMGQPSPYNSREDELAYVNYRRKANTIAIPSSIAEEFNKQYQALRYYNEEGAKEVDRESEKVFLRSVWDALNESLDQERPGGLDGRPLPWLHKSKHLKNLKYKYIYGEEVVEESKAGEEYDLVFGVAIARICQWASFLCGFLADTVQFENTEIDEDYMTHIREGRMAFFLEKSVDVSVFRSWKKTTSWRTRSWKSLKQNYNSHNAYISSQQQRQRRRYIGSDYIRILTTQEYSNQMLHREAYLMKERVQSKQPLVQGEMVLRSRIRELQDQVHLLRRTMQQHQRICRKNQGYQQSNGQYHEAMKQKNYQLNSKVSELLNESKMAMQRQEEEQRRYIYEREQLIGKCSVQSEEILALRKQVSTLHEQKIRQEEQLGHLQFVIEKEAAQDGLEIKEALIRMETMERTYINTIVQKDEEIMQLGARMRVYQDQNRRLESMNKTMGMVEQYSAIGKGKVEQYSIDKGKIEQYSIDKSSIDKGKIEQYSIDKENVSKQEREGYKNQKIRENNINQIKNQNIRLKMQLENIKKQINRNKSIRIDTPKKKEEIINIGVKSGSKDNYKGNDRNKNKIKQNKNKTKQNKIILIDSQQEQRVDVRQQNELDLKQYNAKSILKYNQQSDCQVKQQRSDCQGNEQKSDERVSAMISSLMTLRRGLLKQFYQVFYKSVREGERRQQNSLILFIQNWKSIELERIKCYVDSYFQSRASLKTMSGEKVAVAVPLHINSRTGRNQINQWILSTVQFTKNQRETSKKNANNNLLFLFRLLTIQYRIRFPMKGKSYQIDQDVRNQLHHCIVKGVRYLILQQ